MPDPILLWNEVALEANRISHTNGQGEQAGPPLSARALAIVHLAMYDAYAGASGDPALARYFDDNLPAPAGGAEVNAAVAAAAYRSLTALFPSQTPYFRSIFQGAGTPSGAGYDFGVAVADRILAHRAGDPGVGSIRYKPSPARGRHRPDPDNLGQGFHAPDYGSQSRGFGISTRFRLAPPPLDNEEYRVALREVRSKGIKPELMGTLPDNAARRTSDETTIGLYWGYDGAAQLGTPPRLYNQIVRVVAQARNNTPADNARLFAFVNVAMADAGILAWEQKYIHDFWRPVVAIREHDRSMGPAAPAADNNLTDDTDPLWLPLGAPNTNRIGKNFTPPFPAYPSGHATFGAAALHITRRFYDAGGRYNGGVGSTLGPDNLFDGLDFVSEELNGVSTDNTGAARPRHRRNFPGGLWRMIEENGRSRVFLGVHWVFDAFAVTEDGDPDLARKDGDDLPYGGVPLGLLVAEDVFDHGGGKGPRVSTVEPQPMPEDSMEGRVPTFSSSFPE